MDDTYVANLTLGRLGVGKAIASLTENTVEAKACSRFYTLCRQDVLRAFPWNFALKAEAMAVFSGQTFPGWGYVYQYPNGCLTLRSVGDEGGIRTVRDYAWLRYQDAAPYPLPYRLPWKVALKSDGASRVVLTDMADAWAFYTADVDNPGAWSIDFASVFAWRLAMEVGGPLSAKKELVSAATNAYVTWAREAQAASLNEELDDMPSDSASITSRL